MWVIYLNKYGLNGVLSLYMDWNCHHHLFVNPSLQKVTIKGYPLIHVLCSVMLADVSIFIIMNLLVKFIRSNYANFFWFYLLSPLIALLFVYSVFKMYYFMFYLLCASNFIWLLCIQDVLFMSYLLCASNFMAT